MTTPEKTLQDIEAQYDRLEREHVPDFRIVNLLSLTFGVPAVNEYLSLCEEQRKLEEEAQRMVE